MKKPKLLNKLDKTIKAEVDAAEKLRKKVVRDGVEASIVVLSSGFTCCSWCLSVSARVSWRML